MEFGSREDNGNDGVIVCIPAYNESRTIGKIIETAKNYADEIVVYDDGSTDDTAEIAKLAGATTVIRSTENKGYGAAMKAMFKQAKERKANVMVTLDADGQHDPNQIPDILKPLRESGIDIVIGSRFLNSLDRERIPNYRKLGISVITRLTKSISYNNITDAQSGFRAYSRRAISKINISEQGMTSVTEILMKAKDNNLLVAEVPIAVKYDVDDPHTHNPVSHGVTVAYSVIQFITIKHPLACYGLPGIIILVIAALFLNDALNHFAENRYVSVPLILLSAASTIIAIILLVTGATLYSIKALLKGHSQ